MPHNYQFDLVIEKLREWREQIITDLRAPETHEEALKLKRQLDTAVGCLELCQRHQVHPNCHVTVLPPTQTQSPSSNYRVMEDHESDNREHWVELKIEGETLQLYPGDIIIS